MAASNLDFGGFVIFSPTLASYFSLLLIVGMIFWFILLVIGWGLQFCSIQALILDIPFRLNRSAIYCKSKSHIPDQTTPFALGVELHIFRSRSLCALAWNKLSLDSKVVFSDVITLVSCWIITRVCRTLNIVQPCFHCASIPLCCFYITCLDRAQTLPCKMQSGRIFVVVNISTFQCRFLASGSPSHYHSHTLLIWILMADEKHSLLPMECILRHVQFLTRTAV